MFFEKITPYLTSYPLLLIVIILFLFFVIIGKLSSKDLSKILHLYRRYIISGVIVIFVIAVSFQLLSRQGQGKQPVNKQPEAKEKRPPGEVIEQQGKYNFVIKHIDNFNVKEDLNNNNHNGSSSQTDTTNKK